MPAVRRGGEGLAGMGRRRANLAAGGSYLRDLWVLAPTTQARRL
ncbi:hypothetical protein [Plantactinospora sp. WMMB782]